jgi:hypothetical protein
MSTDQRPAPANLHIVRGADYSIVLTFTNTVDGTPYAVNTATFAADLLDNAASIADSFASAVAGGGNNELTLTLTDAETAALTAQDKYRFALDITEGTDTTPLLVGQASFYDRGQSGGGDEDATRIAVMNGAVTIAFS